MSLDSEQQEILNLVDSYCKNLDTKWNKFKGCVVCRIIKDFIERHLSPDIYKVADPNVYLDEFPYEFELIICNSNSEPRNLTSSFKPSNVHSVIEIKKGGIFSPKQIISINQIFKDVTQKNVDIKCAYLTIEEVNTTKKPESKNFYDICKKELHPYGFFALRGRRGNKQLIPNEWKSFLNYIKLRSDL